MELKNYKIFDSDNLVCEGDAKKCGSYLGIPAEHISAYARRQSKVGGRYSVVCTNGSGRRDKSIYNLYDPEGNHLLSGTNSAIRDYLGAGRNFKARPYAMDHRRFKGKYPITFAGDMPVKAEIKRYDYIKESLLIYGNTCTPKKCDISEIMEYLGESDIHADAVKSPYGGYILTRQ